MTLTAFAFAVWTIEAIQNLQSVSDPQMRPDGREFAYVHGGNVYLQTIDASGTIRSILPGARPRWSPGSQRLAMLQAGQIHIGDVPNGILTKLTDSPTPVTHFAWSPDGETIGYLAPDRGPSPDPVVAEQNYRFSRLYLIPRSGGVAELVSGPRHHVTGFAISPDGKSVVYAASPTPRNRDLFHFDLCRVDLATGVETKLVSQPGRDADPSFSPDGKWVSFHSQAGSLNYFEARHVAIVAATGGPIRYLTKNSALDVFRNGNVFAWSADSKSIVYTAGQGIRDVLVRKEIDSGAEKILATDISGAASFTPDLTKAVFLKTSPERPSEVFALEDGKERQLTEVHRSLAGYPKMRSEVVQWKAHDGLAVEGVLWLPFDYQPGKRVPMLTELHGGPTGVAQNTFPTPRIYPTQLFLQQGIAVFVPNFRGSSNYGAAFRLKNTLSQGVGDYDDVMTGIDHLIQRGIADPNRLGVMGWSYGGYLTAATVPQTHRFKAASIGAPATDWITYYGQSEGPRETLWTYFGGTPWDAPQNYTKHSPRSKLKDIRTPCLLQVGSEDINHNSEIYAALADHNVPVEYVVYPREGHGIIEPAHVRDLLERNYRWFLKWLK